MILKNKIILALVFFSLPLSAMDDAQKQEFMKNGQKYAEMLNLNTPESRLEFMRNSEKVQEAVKTTVYIDSKPVVSSSGSESTKKEDSPSSSEEETLNDPQTNINIEPKKEKTKSSEVVLSTPHKRELQKKIKINLTTINNGRGNIIINMYGSSVTYTKGTNYNDDQITEEHE